MTNSHHYGKKTLNTIMKKRKIVIPGILIIIVGAILTILGMDGNNDPELIIGKEKVSEEEFIRAMSNEKYDVTQHFFRKYGAEVDGDFWMQEYDGESPYKMLTDNTLDSLSLIHAIYGIAKEKGYLDTVGYNDLLERFETENNDRAAKIKKGEPVYGLAEFSLDLFLEYEMDALEKMYTNDLENEGMAISQEDGDQYYEENKDKLFVKNDDVEIEYIKIYYASLGLEESEVNGLEDDLTAVYKDLTDDATLESLLTGHERLVPYYQKIKILSEEVSARAKEMGDVLELSKDLENGESTQVINQNGSLYLIRCIERVNYDYLPYELVKDNILKTLREENYGQIVAEKAEQLSINGDIRKVYAFTKEQLKQ